MDTWTQLPWSRDEAAKRFVREHPDGADVATIAEVMGLSQVGVYKCLQRAIAKLARVPTMLDSWLE